MAPLASGFPGEAIWAIKTLRDETLLLFAAADEAPNTLRAETIEPAVTLVAMTQGREVVEDYRAVHLSLPAHPIGFLRERLAAKGYRPCRTLRKTPDGRRIAIAGLIFARQMPGSAKGVMFITLEDESANANLIVWPSVLRRTGVRSSEPRCWDFVARFKKRTA